MKLPCCIKCQTELRPNVKFCHRCGTEAEALVATREPIAKELPIDLSAAILEKCDRQKSEFSIVCHSCQEANIIPALAFTDVPVDRSGMRIVATDKSIPVSTKTSDRVSWVLSAIPAAYLGSYVGSIVLRIPFAWTIVAAVLFSIFRPVVRSLLPFGHKRLPIWLVQCKKCGERITLASDGSEAFKIKNR